MTTYEHEIEVRRPSGMGTKILVLACAILAVLGSFWAIVWFIRAYVEPPRVMMPAPMLLAARESTPVAPPASPSAQPQPAETRSTPLATEAQAAPTVTPPSARSAPSTPPREAAEPAPSVADRWAPMNQFGSPPAMSAPPPAPAAAAPVEPAPAVAAAPEAEADEVVESAVPAIEGPPPLPRRKPIVTAAARRADPPLPRPRPDGQVAPQSVWTAVPTTDDRFPQQ